MEFRAPSTTCTHNFAVCGGRAPGTHTHIHTYSNCNCYRIIRADADDERGDTRDRTTYTRPTNRFSMCSVQSLALLWRFIAIARRATNGDDVDDGWHYLLALDRYLKFYARRKTKRLQLKIVTNLKYCDKRFSSSHFPSLPRHPSTWSLIALRRVHLLELELKKWNKSERKICGKFPIRLYDLKV